LTLSAQDDLELDLIAQGNIVHADQGDALLDLSRLIDGATVNSNQFKPALLIEAQRIQVVIGRDQENAPAVLLARLLDDRTDQSCSQPLSFP
jgi:hypothetical protein